MTTLPEAAYAAALAALDRMTLQRLTVLLDHATPARAFAIATGDAAPTGMARQLLTTEGLADCWRAAARRRPPEQLWQRCAELGVSVLTRTDACYPPVLLADPAPPPILFVRGDLARLTGRRAAIVGTRNATGAGRDIATTLGNDLAEHGVHVVSGLARGIDGCAHRGALAVDGGAGPIAVVASGHDVIYPREHASLWNAVAEQGALISEAPPGTAPETHRFPLRNRIIAGLSEVVVVVESRSSGGSLITARAARDRGIPVMAVPGSPRNRSSEGTNALIRDGCELVTESRDVLVALSLDTSRITSATRDARPRPTGVDLTMMELCGEPRTLDQCTILTGLTLTDCAMSLARLEADGWIHQINGWFERAAQNGAIR